MSGRLTDTMGKRFEALADCYDQRAGDGRNVDPITSQVLGLQASVWGGLKKVASEHAILVRPHALALGAAFFVKGGGIGVFHDFELVLLIGVEEAIKCCGGQEQGFGDQGGECCGEGGHLGDVGFVDGAEGGKKSVRRPLVWREEVMVEWGGGGG